MQDAPTVPEDANERYDYGLPGSLSRQRTVAAERTHDGGGGTSYSPADAMRIPVDAVRFPELALVDDIYVIIWAGRTHHSRLLGCRPRRLA